MAFAIFSRIVRALAKKKNKKKNVPLNSYPCPQALQATIFGISIESLLLEEKKNDTIMRQSIAMMNSKYWTKLGICDVLALV